MWLQGACMVAGGMHGCQGSMHGCRGHAWLWGGMHRIRRDTVNERAYASYWNAFLFQSMLVYVLHIITFLSSNSLCCYRKGKLALPILIAGIVSITKSHPATVVTISSSILKKSAPLLWLIHTARDRDRDRDWETMGFCIMLYTVHTTQ